LRIDIETIAPFALVMLLGLLLYMKKRQNKSTGFLICFAVFYVYIFCVIGYTIFPLIMHTNFIETMRQESTLMSGINLVPFRFSLDYLLSRQVIGNVVLGVPFGFGLPFITKVADTRSVVRKGLLFAASIELLQLALDLIYRFAYRAVDVNDLLFNFSGVMIGFGLFRVIASLYNSAFENEPIAGIWSYIHAVLTRQ